jgi:hypothetical protein
MTTPQIKPGTRCECSSLSCPGQHPAQGPDNRKNPLYECGKDAVRTVTVRVSTVEARRAGSWNALGHEAEVPMCAPCASFHEAKAGAR